MRGGCAQSRAHNMCACQPLQPAHRSAHLPAQLHTPIRTHDTRTRPFERMSAHTPQDHTSTCSQVAPAHAIYPRAARALRRVSLRTPPTHGLRARARPSSCPCDRPSATPAPHARSYTCRPRTVRATRRPQLRTADPCLTLLKLSIPCELPDQNQARSTTRSPQPPRGGRPAEGLQVVGGQARVAPESRQGCLRPHRARILWPGRGRATATLAILAQPCPSLHAPICADAWRWQRALDRCASLCANPTHATLASAVKTTLAESRLLCVGKGISRPPPRYLFKLRCVDQSQAMPRLRSFHSQV